MTDTKSQWTRVTVPVRVRFQATCGHTVESRMVAYANPSENRVECRKCHEGR